MLQPVELYVFIQQFCHRNIVSFLRRKARPFGRLKCAEAFFIFNLCNTQLRRFVRIKPFRERFFIIGAAIADLIFLTFFRGTILSLL